MTTILHYEFENGGTAQVRIRPSVREGFVAKGDYSRNEKGASSERAISHVIGPFYGAGEEALRTVLREELEAAYGRIAAVRTEPGKR